MGMGMRCRNEELMTSSCKDGSGAIRRLIATELS